MIDVHRKMFAVNWVKQSITNLAWYLPSSPLRPSEATETKLTPEEQFKADEVHVFMLGQNSM